ncbi:unnamed protein product [Acanthoscelides obtectus]|uniref:Uncharacterized protein n=1 Tax=Acanthoscelides obtectus TaxID=200917 RepID=A0A9P0PCY6_ACAOB|nr:unnamed protein product [Acanthoscelides obtectus]CAK1635907.1 hypothetical protein AOBTE_LOCUS9614 [Acanthoscelides obtectus]
MYRRVFIPHVAANAYYSHMHFEKVKSSFKQDLINFPWWLVVDCDNVNQKTAILSDMILTLFDSHAPICEKKVTRPPSPWFTDELRALKNHRNYLFSKYKRTKNLRDWASYKEMRNFFTSAVRQEKRAYIDFVSRTKKSKDMWKTLDQLNIYNRSKKNIEIPNHHKNPNLISQYFSDSVRQILSTVDTNTISKYLNSKCTTTVFELKLVSEDDVFWAISEIGSNASGADGISLDMNAQIIVRQNIFLKLSTQKPVNIYYRDTICRELNNIRHTELLVFGFGTALSNNCQVYDN